MFVIFPLIGALLFVPFAFSIVCIVYVIVVSSQIKKLQKFSLVLENGTVSVCGKKLVISEKLAMRIVIHSFGLDPLSTKLTFEPLGLSPFSRLTKVERYLNYPEKRGLAEQFSMNLKIQLTDMFSSFEPGVYGGKLNFLEKFKISKCSPPSQKIAKLYEDII